MTYAAPTPTDDLSQPYYGASIAEATRRFWKKYATFTGRASRSEYWWWTLIAVIVGVVIEILSAVGNAGSNGSGPGGLTVFALILSILWLLATIVPSLALVVRRLHDANYNGWFILLGLIPFVGGLILLVFMLLPSNPAGQRFDR
jgi:uncharacterized membrane protein YhaH (DUF805 family)